MALFCPTITVVEAAIGIALVAEFDAALTTPVFGVAEAVGVITALLCCIQNPMPMSPAMRIVFTMNK